MAVQRVLAIIAGKVTEYVAAIISSGAASSGQLVALNASGQIDLTMMPTGVGPDTLLMPATEAIGAGAYVNVYSNAGIASIRNADGSTIGKEAAGFTTAAIASGASGTVYFSGINSSVTAQTAGPVFLSDTTIGAGSATAATTAGHTYQQIGVALSATAVQFNPQPAIGRA